MLHSIHQQIWKTQQWPQNWKRPVFIPIPKKGNAKECSGYHTIVFISHGSQVMLKILQARLQQYTKQKLSDIQAGFRKGRGTRGQIANICWIIEKATIGNSRETFVSLTRWKTLTVWITTNCGKLLLKRWEWQSTLPILWKTCICVRSQQLEPYMEQLTGQNWGRSKTELCIVTLFV